MTLTEAKDLAAIIATVIAVPGVLFAAIKTWQELKRIREQRDSEIEQRRRSNEQHETELERKRIEFTLAQHRRLFDDKALCTVLERLDGDQETLRDPTIIEAKRKFLTFFEEMILLRNSGYISPQVALYMFGYYAAAAHAGTNFKYGIDYKPEYWSLFMTFASEAELYLCSNRTEDLANLRL